jgi:hypothetical protein
MVIQVLAAASIALTALKPVAPCATASPTLGALFFLESTSTARDTIVTVRVCLATSAATHIGKVRLTIPYDSLSLRLTTSTTGGRAFTANVSIPGMVSITGAAPNGVATGIVATLMFRRLGRASPIAAIAVRKPLFVDATATNGRPIAGGVRVSGLPSTIASAPTKTLPVTKQAAREIPAPSAVRIDSIVPRAATVTSGALIAVMIYGKGFTATANSVLLNGVAVASIRSTDSVTARLIVPATFPGTSEVAPRTVAPGEYTLQIKNTSGTSNTVTLTLRAP